MKGISLLWSGNAGGPSLTQAPDPGAVRWARGTPPGGHGPQWALCPLPHPTWGPLTAPRLTDVLSDPHLDHHVSMRTCTQARTKQCAHTCDCICTSLKHKAGSTVGGGAGLRPTSIGSHGEKVTGGGVTLLLPPLWPHSTTTLKATLPPGALQLKAGNQDPGGMNHSGSPCKLFSWRFAPADWMC